LSRPSITRKELAGFPSITEYLSRERLHDAVFEQAEIEIKYAGYIEKERRNADKLKRLENIIIPKNFDFDQLASLSFEAKEKLNKLRPGTLAQASRISGINPSDISVLLVSMGR
jgi:tRNA uridine 5-carboxymethylaminomethyl modification enzyme